MSPTAARLPTPRLFTYSDGTHGVRLKGRRPTDPRELYDVGRAIGQMAPVGCHLPHPGNFDHPDAVHNGMVDALNERGMDVSLGLVVIDGADSAQVQLDRWDRARRDGRADDAAYFLDRAYRALHIEMHHRAAPRSYSAA